MPFTKFAYLVKKGPQEYLVEVSPTGSGFSIDAVAEIVRRLEGAPPAAAAEPAKVAPEPRKTLIADHPFRPGKDFLDACAFVRESKDPQVATRACGAPNLWHEVSFAPPPAVGGMMAEIAAEPSAPPPATEPPAAAAPAVALVVAAAAAEPAGEKGLPPEIVGAKQIRDVVRYLRDVAGLKDVEKLVKQCEKLKDRVPLLAKVTNLDNRVRSTVARLEAEADDEAAPAAGA